MIREALSKLVEGQELDLAEVEAATEEIMRGEATPAQVGAFLTALRLRGETPTEIAGFARAMRKAAIPVRPKRADLVDTCGTGGDGRGTFNISTIAAFVVAGAGLGVAKHGNRSISSRCGSANLVEALGVKLTLNSEQIARCIDEVGIGFLFAPALHPAMKHATPIRRELGIRTVFNVLGPLTNPAGAKRQLLGVYSPKLTETLAEVLENLGSEHALVVHGANGLDELSTTGVNKVSELSWGQIKTYYLDPQELGLPRARLADVAGGTLEENVRIAYEVLEGKPGPRRDIVLLNAAAALIAGGRASNFEGGLTLAAQSIDAGWALQKLEELVRMTAALEGEDD